MCPSTQRPIGSRSAHHDQCVDVNRALAGHIADTEIVHRVEGVGTDLNPRSHFAEAIGL